MGRRTETRNRHKTRASHVRLDFPSSFTRPWSRSRLSYRQRPRSPGAFERASHTTRSAQAKRSRIQTWWSVRRRSISPSSRWARSHLRQIDHGVQLQHLLPRLPSVTLILSAHSPLPPLAPDLLDQLSLRPVLAYLSPLSLPARPTHIPHAAPRKDIQNTWLFVLLFV